MRKSIITFRDVHRLRIDVVVERTMYVEMQLNQCKVIFFLIPKGS